MKMLLFLMHQFPRVPSSKPMRDIHGIFSTIFNNGYYMPCVAMAGLLTCRPVSNAFPLSPNDR